MATKDEGFGLSVEQAGIVGSALLMLQASWTRQRNKYAVGSPMYVACQKEVDRVVEVDALFKRQYSLV